MSIKPLCSEGFHAYIKGLDKGEDQKVGEKERDKRKEERKRQNENTLKC